VPRRDDDAPRRDADAFRRDIDARRLRAPPLFLPPLRPISE